MLANKELNILKLNHCVNTGKFGDIEKYINLTLSAGNTKLIRKNDYRTRKTINKTCNQCLGFGSKG